MEISYVLLDMLVQMKTPKIPQSLVFLLLDVALIREHYQQYGITGNSFDLAIWLIEI